VQAFLAASKAGDLQAMSAVWGTADGTIRNQMPRQTVEERETYIIACTKHDRFQIISEGNGAPGQRVLAVQLTRGTLTRSANFTTGPATDGRWYVFKLELEKLNDLCLAK
jgi:hypothetical protein